VLFALVAGQDFLHLVPQFDRHHRFAVIGDDDIGIFQDANVELVGEKYGVASGAAEQPGFLVDFEQRFVFGLHLEGF
jgi:hypothetical protein